MKQVCELDTPVLKRQRSEPFFLSLDTPDFKILSNGNSSS